MNIYSDISLIKGVGPKLKEKLNSSGIFNILDLLLYFPRDYEFIATEMDTNEIIKDEKVILRCIVESFESDIRTKTGKRLTTIKFKCNDKVIFGKWFNQPYIKNKFRIGETYNLLGKFKPVPKGLEVVNPTIACNDATQNKIVPKYSLKDNLTSNILGKLIHQILDNVVINENLPKDIIAKYNLVNLNTAIRNIHFPTSRDSLKKAIDRLKFQELFTYSLKILLLKKHLKNNKNGIAFRICEELKILKEKLPFQLTNAQSRVIREILLDQKKESPMNRLVQGDVGSGKTILAFIAMFNVYKNGYQAVMMAPTEILAYQHFEECKKLLNPFGVEIEILCGSVSNKEKIRIKKLLESNKSLIVIGTHALIQEDVNFSNLGLVITDEQHRFGVEQRNSLINKGKEVDVLVMTATPIPRTLALYLYSDLDVSIIDELPPGRKKIKTIFYDMNNRLKAYEQIKEEINKGRQAYIVCPLIEENEDVKLNSVEKIYSELSKGIFKNFEIQILHGKMSASDKENIIQLFKENKINVLISTTVIEVGVNVPNASIMVIENSERFGLSQLHQLRGRVGRGNYQSYCILIGKANNEITKRRMEIMTESTDGFYISEQDLKLRGAGEMFGSRQHGDSELLLADMIEDVNILRCANEEAKRILARDDSSSKCIIDEIMKNLQRSSKYICFN